MGIIKHLFLLLFPSLLISRGDASFLFDFDATSTTTPSPPYEEKDDFQLYYPYGSRTSTTTGPPSYNNPYDYYRQGKGIFPRGDYTTTTTTTPRFCEGLNCSSLSTPFYFSETPGAWLEEGARYLPENQREEYYKGFRPDTPEDSLSPMGGKYPTKILSVVKPSKEARERCKFDLSVFTLTKKARLFLKNGKTEVYVQPDDETVLIKAFSENQKVPSSSFLGFVWQRLKAAFVGDDEVYEYLFSVPPYCGRVHQDPAAVTAEEKEGKNIKNVLFRLSPEITAVYAPSPHPITFSFDFSKIQKNQFARLRKCLYGVNITNTFIPGSLMFSSSQRIATITARDNAGGYFIIASILIPCECRPSKLGDISWWLKQSADNNPFVLVYFGYGEKQGHPTCETKKIRKGELNELDIPIDYETMGFWND